MKHSRLYLCISICLLLAGLFSNCADVGFTSADGNSKVAGDPLDSSQVQEIIKTCEKAAGANTLQAYSTTVNFKDTKEESGRDKVCRFKSGDASDNSPDAAGNYTQLNNELRARYEQYSAVTLPNNATVCGIELSAPDQPFKYDDVIYITLNNWIMATNLKASLANTEIVEQQLENTTMRYHKYDWSKVAKSNFEGVNDKADDYCSGMAEGFGDCAWPLSQQSGEIRMAFDPEVLVPMSTASKTQTFGFIVTGDNDPDSDCYHQNLDLDVKIHYVVN